MRHNLTNPINRPGRSVWIFEDCGDSRVMFHFRIEWNSGTLVLDYLTYTQSGALCECSLSIPGRKRDLAHWVNWFRASGVLGVLRSNGGNCAFCYIERHGSNSDY